MKIAKAYEALTDEAARENYEKFGNPDGKQALEVSIGLPTWILENPKVVLVLYLIGMVVVIPVAVGLWYSNSKQYGEKNIKYETYSLFFQLLGEGSRLKNMPEVFAAATECRDIHQPDLDREVGVEPLWLCVYIFTCVLASYVQLWVYLSISMSGMGHHVCAAGSTL